MITFHERLKVLRKEKNLTQKEIANELGVRQNTYSHWENGKTEPNIEYIIRLAHILNVPIDFLLTGYTEYIGDKNDIEIGDIVFEKLCDKRIFTTIKKDM